MARRKKFDPYEYYSFLVEIDLRDASGKTREMQEAYAGLYDYSIQFGNLPDDDEAEEIEVFKLCFFRRTGSFQGRLLLDTELYSVAYNVANHIANRMGYDDMEGVVANKKEIVKPGSFEGSITCRAYDEDEAWKYGYFVAEKIGQKAPLNIKLLGSAYIREFYCCIGARFDEHVLRDEIFKVKKAAKVLGWKREMNLKERYRARIY